MTVSSNSERFTNDDLLRQAVNGASSRREVLERLGIPESSQTNYYKPLQEACARFGIELPNGTLAPSKGTTEWQLRLRADRLFVEHGTKNIGKALKPLAFALGLLEELCAECGLGTEWNDAPLVLHLDHINGTSTDHRIENLRLLCPNCHSQTDTYCGRNVRRGGTSS